MTFIQSKLGRALPDWIVAVVRHGRQHHTIPSFIHPKTFNEKILNRIIFDRSPWMSMVTDKFRVRDYVSERVGDNILPKLYFVTTEPDTIPFASLPNRFVIKPTHGSGWVEVVHDKGQLDQVRLLRTCRSWLSQSYYETTREWIYRDITPRILVEEFIDDGSGGAPNDYKLFVFGGRVEFILVTMGRFDIRAHLLLDREWNPVDVILAYSRRRRVMARPPHLIQMIEVAEKLAYGMNFVRADFYDTPERLIFGELTSMPGGGLDRFEPASFDHYLGSLWKLGNAA